MPAIGGGGPFTNPPTNSTTVQRALLALGATLTIAIGGVSYFAFSTTSFSPSSDLGSTLGEATKRFGGVFVGSDGLAATTATDVSIVNNTDSTDGARVQVSGATLWHGEGWDTTAPGDGNHTEEWRAYVVPQSGASVSSYLHFERSQDGAAFSTVGQFTPNGFVVTGVGQFSGDLSVNGEDITCDSASAATVFNSTATSVAIAGAGDLIVSGGSGSTGCTVTGSTGDLACSGDATFGGGHRFCYRATTLNDIPAADIKADGFYFFPYAGSYEGVAAYLNGTIIAGTITCYWAGSSGVSVSFTSADVIGTQKSITEAKGAHTFTANSAGVITCAGSADLNPATVDMYVAGCVEL